MSSARVAPAHEVVVRSTLAATPRGVVVSATLLDAGKVKATGDERLRLRIPVGSTASAPAPGETWAVEGRVSRHPVHGLQIDVAAGRRTEPPGGLVCGFLRSAVPGLGETRSRRLGAAFGEGLPRALAAGDATAIASAVAPTRPALGMRIAVAAIEAWREIAAEAELALWLDRNGIRDPAVLRTAALVLGPGARAKLDADPYLLVALLPWRVVDAVGLRVLADAGHPSPASHMARLVGAADAAVKDAILAGHTLLDHGALRTALARLLGTGDRGIVDAAVAAGVRQGALVPHAGGHRAPGCAVMEEAVQERLAAMLANRGLGAWRPAVPVPSPEGRQRLHPEQVAAVRKVLATPVACLQGGAGVGKTHAVRAVCEAWESVGGDVVLCALAGKAALRLSQATGRPAKTLFKTLLEADLRGARETDGGGPPGTAIGARTLVVVDEASMVDLTSIHSLLARMPAGARLLLVGDERQLPPVGVGVVFHRLVGDEGITARLATIHRQAAGSAIPEAAEAVRSGRKPATGAYAGPRPGVHLVPTEERPQLAEAVLAVAADLGAGTMVVAPTRTGPGGVDDLNARSHAVAAPGAPAVLGRAGEMISAGEPVIHLSNDYERGIYNGSLGVAVEVDPASGSLIAAFDGERIAFDRREASQLALAYAITCHRAQGSQARRVVIALYESRLLDPSWLYTALTRAEEQVVLVGDPAVLASVAGRPWAADTRRVGFVWPPGGPAMREGTGAGVGNGWRTPVEVG